MEDISRCLRPSSNPPSKGASRLTPRATRIEIEIPVRFRAIGQTGWRQGTTFNMSQSGVKFRADQLLETESLIHITFAVPPEIAGRAGTRTEVACRGRIVRTHLPAASDGRPHLAAKILDYLPPDQWKQKTGGKQPRSNRG